MAERLVDLTALLEGASAADIRSADGAGAVARAGGETGRVLDDLTRRLTALAEVERTVTEAGKTLGAELAKALEQAVVHGRELDDVLRDVALAVSRTALTEALKPVQGFFSDAFSRVFSGSVSSFASPPKAFAAGGVIGGPALAAMDNGGLAVMGEAGPEAVVPLARGADGRLGVRVLGTGSSAPVTINITTPDVAGFQRSESQVAAMLMRTMNRARRNL